MSDELDARIAAAVLADERARKVDAVRRIIDEETATLRDTLAKRSAALDRVTARLDRVRALLDRWFSSDIGTDRFCAVELREALDDPAEDER